jgi:hypothetical protein
MIPDSRGESNVINVPFIGVIALVTECQIDILPRVSAQVHRDLFPGILSAGAELNQLVKLAGSLSVLEIQSHDT